MNFSRIQNATNATTTQNSSVHFLCVTQAHQRLAADKCTRLCCVHQYMHTVPYPIRTQMIGIFILRFNRFVRERHRGSVCVRACLCVCVSTYEQYAIRCMQSCVCICECVLDCGFRLALLLLLLPLEWWNSANKHFFYSTKSSVSVWTLCWYDGYSCDAARSYITYNIYVIFIHLQIIQYLKDTWTVNTHTHDIHSKTFRIGDLVEIVQIVQKWTVNKRRTILWENLIWNKNKKKKHFSFWCASQHQNHVSDD